MHPELLAAYSEAMPRLEARERLGALAIAAAAGGHLQPEAARSLTAGLLADAEGPRRRAERPRTREAFVRGAAAVGVGVRVVARAPQEAQDGRGAGTPGPSTPDAPEGVRGPRGA
jgi:hypothetical protein